MAEKKYKELSSRIYMVPLTDLMPNPQNPRVIRDERFKALKKSITDFPKMLEYRMAIVDRSSGATPYPILGGNQRFEACKELGHKEMPVMFADDMTEEDKRRFIPVDNVGFGDWNMEMLANEYDLEELLDFGLEAGELHMDGAEDDGDKKEKLQNYSIEYKIVFNNEGEQAEWIEFIKMLKEVYPALDTISERILQYTKDAKI